MRTLTIGSCLAVAITFAYCANPLLEASLRVPPDVGLRAPSGEDQPAELDAHRLARAFGTPLRPNARPGPRRVSRLKLVGTLDEHAAAMVETSSGHCRTLRIGDRWDDVELVEVGHGRATVRREGLLEEVAVGDTMSAPPPGSTALPIAFSYRGAAISMPRAEFERQLPDFAQRLMSGGRVIPAFEGSKMIGLRLVALKPGSLYAELGLQNGDLLEAVNGAALSSPEVAFGLANRLRDQNRITLVVDRGGERLTWDLTLN